jgi:hypothetical protein
MTGTCDCVKLKSFFIAKETMYESEETAHRMEENLFLFFIRQEINIQNI